MKIFVLMAIHNRVAKSLACLEALKRQNFSSLNIVVVDDGSTDGSTQMIKEKFPDVYIITGTGDWWWTLSMNRGLEYILSIAHDTDYVLTMNDDTWFAPEYCDYLISAAQQYPGACIGSVVKNYYDQKTEDSGVLINWWGYTYRSALPVDGAVSPVDTLSCRGAFVPIFQLRRIGFFNEKKLPHYLADYDFFIRAKRLGIPLFISQKAQVFHKDKPNKNLPTDFFWRLFNKKSPSNIKNHWFILITYSPTMLHLIFNSVAYPIRSVWHYVREMLHSYIARKSLIN